MGLLHSPVCLLFPLHVKNSDFLPVQRPGSSGDGSRLQTKSGFGVGHGFRWGLFWCSTWCKVFQGVIRGFWSRAVWAAVAEGQLGSRSAKLRSESSSYSHWISNTPFILCHTLMCILYINTQNHTMSRSKPFSDSLTVSLTNGLQATVTRLAPYLIFERIEVQCVPICPNCPPLLAPYNQKLYKQFGKFCQDYRSIPYSLISFT